jgi:hypothetical protein
MRFSMPWWFWNRIGAQGVFLLRRGAGRGECRVARRPVTNAQPVFSFAFT